ncbi:MAG: NUDIX hydrolase [Candidatus Dojkabacteria bacterium]
MNNQLIYTRKWYPDLKVKEEHKELPVRQVTCFVISSDEKLLLVSKDGNSWSVTAGHYEEKKDPTYLDTAVREVYEESGLDISMLADKIKRVGYYVIEDVEKDSDKVLDTYLQIRTFLPLEKNSKDISLKPIEGDLVKQAKFFSLEESMKLIRWLSESEEWKAIKDIRN